MDADPPTSPTPEPNPFEPPRAAGGKPGRPRYRPLSILGMFLGVVAVLIAGFIAFVVTCVPVGFVAFARSENARGGGGALFWLAWLIGLAAAVLAGFGTFRLVFRSPWRRLPQADEGPDR